MHDQESRIALREQQLKLKEEELKTKNDQLKAKDEKLERKDEQMTAMKEQLGSSNKQMATLNQQLEDKSRLLVESYSDELEQLNSLTSILKKRNNWKKTTNLNNLREIVSKQRKSQATIFKHQFPWDVDMATTDILTWHKLQKNSLFYSFIY